jgi:hypothetical protein
MFNLQNRVTEAASAAFGQPLNYDVTHFGLDFDKTATPLVAAPFSIQRRGNALFSENKYFSEAPLPTDAHIRLLEQFETDLTAR